jgi:hypothetical protein
MPRSDLVGSLLLPGELRACSIHAAFTLCSGMSGIELRRRNMVATSLA